MQNDDGHVQSAAPATKNPTHLLKTSQKYCALPKNVWMSRSATPATRNEATTSLKPTRSTPSAELTIGTAIRGCGRLRPQTQRRADTHSTPRPPEWNGNPCYAFGKKHWNNQVETTIWWTNSPWVWHSDVVKSHRVSPSSSFVIECYWVHLLPRPTAPFQLSLRFHGPLAHWCGVCVWSIPVHTRACNSAVAADQVYPQRGLPKIMHIAKAIFC